MIFADNHLLFLIFIEDCTNHSIFVLFNTAVIIQCLQTYFVFTGAFISLAIYPAHVLCVC